MIVDTNPTDMAQELRDIRDEIDALTTQAVGALDAAVETLYTRKLRPDETVDHLLERIAARCKTESEAKILGLHVLIAEDIEDARLSLSTLKTDIEIGADLDRTGSAIYGRLDRLIDLLAAA